MSASIGAEPVDRATNTHWVAFAGVALSFFITTAAVGVPTPLFVAYERQWGFPPALLTAAFGIYAISLLITVLVAGALSDYIGRRPVLIGALAVQVVAMLLFVGAQDIGWIIGARAIQGVSAGLSASAFLAFLVELVPERRRAFGAVIGGAVPTAGLAIGALASGVLVQAVGASPSQIFLVLTVLTVISVIIVILSPETNGGRPGAGASLIPRIAIPHPARAAYRASIPAVAAAWMLTGLALSLGPSIIQAIFRVQSGGLNGFAAFLVPGLATIATLAAGKLSMRATRLWGAGLLVGGAALVILALATGVLAVLLIGLALGGLGFGGTFSGTLRTLAALVGPAERAGLLAAAFLVAYLSYGVPAFIAGAFVQSAGLLVVAIVYAAIVLVLALVGLLARVRVDRPGDAVAAE